MPSHCFNGILLYKVAFVNVCELVHQFLLHGLTSFKSLLDGRTHSLSIEYLLQDNKV